jgi:hypothetical protein
MWLSRIMHVETHLLYDEGDVGSCQCQELERARQTAVSRRVFSGRVISGELVLGIDQRWSRFTIRHSYMFQNVFRVPFLRKVEAMCGLLDIDAKEEAKRSHVFEHELGTEAVDDVLE